MAGRSPAPPEIIAEWTEVLHNARRDVQAAEQALRQAKQRFRDTVNGAFRAGLSVRPISEAIGLTPSRTYQISAGRRT